MIHTTEEFLQWWTSEAHNTSELLAHIHDEELRKSLIPREKNIGEMLWSLLQTPCEILKQGGLAIRGPTKGSAPPKTMGAYVDEQSRVVKSVLEQVHKNWPTESLDQTFQVDGQTWRRRDALLAILLHLIHHRGRLTVMMQLSGCETPSIYPI